MGTSCVEVTYWQKNWCKWIHLSDHKNIFLYYVRHFAGSLSTTFGKIQNLDTDESPSVSAANTDFVPVTAEPGGCLWRRWLGPPAGSWPAVPASASWSCRLSAPGQRCCLSAGLADTDAGLLELWGKGYHVSQANSLFCQHIVGTVSRVGSSKWQREVNLFQ